MVVEGNRWRGMRLLWGLGEGMGRGLRVVVVYGWGNGGRMRWGGWGMEIGVMFFRGCCRLVIGLMVMCFEGMFWMGSVGLVGWIWRGGWG